MMPGSNSEQDRLADLDISALELGSSVQKLPLSSLKLGGAVPVRFRRETIEAVKQVADGEGVSVSAWIRRQVEDSLSRHETARFRSNVFPIRPEVALGWIFDRERRERVGVPL